MKNKSGGGNQTNINGLKFEQETSLESIFNTKKNYKVCNQNIFYNDEHIATLAGKHSLYKIILEPMGINFKDRISKKLLPDEALFILETQTIYIIEKKFQSGHGSVDEKLQTCDFKRKQYQKLFEDTDITVEYIYLLNDWFKKDNYKDVLEYITSVNCHYYFNEIPLSFLNLAM